MLYTDDADLASSPPVETTTESSKVNATLDTRAECPSNFLVTSCKCSVFIESMTSLKERNAHKMGSKREEVAGHLWLSAGKRKEADESLSIACHQSRSEICQCHAIYIRIRRIVRPYAGHFRPCHTINIALCLVSSVKKDAVLRPRAPSDILYYISVRNHGALGHLKNKNIK